MNPRLRNRHLYIWLGLALLLPLLGAAVLFQLPASSYATSEISSGSLMELSHTLEESASEEFTVSVGSESPGATTDLQIAIKEALQQPAAWVYVSPQSEIEVEEAVLLGPIGERGVFQFELDSLSSQWEPLFVTIYDGIHQQITHQIEL